MVSALLLPSASTSRPRSANSWWWKFDSANQRSTRAGTLRPRSAARSAASSVSACAARWSKIGAAGRLARLDDDDRRLGLLRDRSRAARRRAARRPCRIGRRQRGGAHDHQLRALRLAHDRRPDVVALDEQWLRRLAARAGARTSRARARPGRGRPGRCRAGRRGRRRRRRRSAAEGAAKRSASSACGPPRTGARIRRTVLDAALLDHRDVARRVAHDLVDGRREDGFVAAPRRPARPPQPKMIRSASSSVATSTMPSAARRPMRTTVRRSMPVGANSSTRCRRRRACRARVAPSDSGMPSGTSTMPSAVSMPPGSISAAPMRTRSAAVRGLASGSRMRAAGSGQASPPRLMPAPASRQRRRGTAWPARTPRLPLDDGSPPASVVMLRSR